MEPSDPKPEGTLEPSSPKSKMVEAFEDHQTYGQANYPKEIVDPACRPLAEEMIGVTESNTEEILGQEPKVAPGRAR